MLYPKPMNPTDDQANVPHLSPEGTYENAQDFRDSGMMGGAGRGDAGAQDTGHLIPGEPMTGDTRTMTTPGSRDADGGTSKGQRISGDDNRQ